MDHTPLPTSHMSTRLAGKFDMAVRPTYPSPQSRTECYQICTYAQLGKCVLSDSPWSRIMPRHKPVYGTVIGLII